MKPEPEVFPEDTATGAVAYMARNGVAANLLMFFIVVIGVFSIGSLVQEVFPEFSLDSIQVVVAYPGATPEEIEESVVQKIEESIEAVEDVDEITSTSSEGLGVVSVQLKLGADLPRALDNIKAEVDRIPTFPDGAERPEVTELTNRSSAIRLAIFGDASERTLKELAYQTEDILSTLPEVSFVETSGVRPYEISIEVEQGRLRALGLTLADVSNAVRRGSLDLSAGSIETSAEQVRLRTVGRNYTQQDFEEIVVLSRADGTVIRLRDVATVIDGFQDSDLITRYNGMPAAIVEVSRTADERVLEIVDAIEIALEETIYPTMPEGVQIEVWENSGEILEARLGLLIKNALIGLSLVLIALTLFLDIRLAFWTAVGIGVSFIGTFAIMKVVGASINMLSLFGFILSVGIVVDDAIVVGENIFAEREKGVSGLRAAIRGVTRVRGPVIFAVLTTIVAFTPLLLVPGTLGKLLGAIPVIVISVLVLSLIESLFVLPHHLSHLPPPHHSAHNRVTRFFEAVQLRVDAALNRFVEGPLDRGLRFATSAPGVVIAGGLALLIISFATVPAGWLRIQFFPEVEGDVVTASLEMNEGTPASVTQTAIERIRIAGVTVAQRYAEERADVDSTLISSTYTVVGQGVSGAGPTGSGGASGLSSNVGAVQVKLLEAEQRTLSAVDFENAWRDEVGTLRGAKSLSFASSVIGGGPPIQVELSHPDGDRLAALGDEVVAELNLFDGVFDVETDRDQGLQEIQLALKPEALSFGLTLDDLARQVRGAFFGDEAQRVQRGREDVRVYVRLPESERDAIADVEDYRIRTPQGAEVPLVRVADVSFGTSQTSIRRTEGQRVLTVTGRVNPDIVTGQEVSTTLREEILPAIQAREPRFTFEFGGEQEDQAEAGAAIASGFVIAMFVIYALLAIPFGSYVQPLVVMSAVPFGLVGAIFGHLILGIPLGLLSIFGIVGLSGVVVNDSLVMIDFINERVRQGLPYREAIRDGAKKRFRPILLTSLTTFLGVAPLVVERSLQAQFLIPMAAALAFGILFATAVLMMIVPALATLQLGWAHRRNEARAANEAKLDHGVLAGGVAGD